ncbi:hypothetical protein L1987_55663 [Smallanthus sonchifolius]|uniref:Uncharacterized protein n=1 Tax=Smallanthus sonchifolius TaxID=185202 RepID=A0ACB9EA96_9ASTR|nr:hypothetical protein L1987_55663 [Smallanthus sonchifolius]
MASLRFFNLLLILIIASSVSAHTTDVGAQGTILIHCTTSCCIDVDCSVLCAQPPISASHGLCKPDDVCAGGLCCCY